MERTLMVELPDVVFKRVKRFAEAIGQPVEKTVARIVEFELPPLLDVPEEFEEDVKVLERLNDKELLEIMHSRVSLTTQRRLHRLLQKNRLGTLTLDERLTLETLQREADIVMLRKAHAAVILKWRGHHIPPQVLPKIGEG
jgi:hypothetical protein